jgi:hypothetical protein
VRRAGKPSTERAGRKAPRGRQGRRGPRSPKAAHIVGLVHALSADFGRKDGVYLGRGIARLLAAAYGKRRGPLPGWVKDLVAHYTAKGGKS